MNAGFRFKNLFEDVLNVIIRQPIGRNVIKESTVGGLPRMAEIGTGNSWKSMLRGESSKEVNDPSFSNLQEIPVSTGIRDDHRV